VTNHDAQSEKPLRVRSEIANELWIKQLAEHAQALEHGFRTLAGRDDDGLKREVEKLGRLNRAGPNPIDAHAPSREAIDLAYAHARLSLAPLRKAIEGLPGRPEADGGDIWLAAPERRTTPGQIPALPAETMWGIPLLAACSPETVPADRSALVRAWRWLVARQHRVFIQVREDFAARLTRFLALETVLWQLAAAHGGPSDRLPYAFRFWALSWFWTPAAHQPGFGACAICIRCGVLIPPTATGRPRRTSPPRCTHCAKESPSARAWPERAIAPDGPGEWWLPCQVAGCDKLFAGWRNEPRCDQHDPSRIARRRR
jgi:hypothetical protein